MISKKMLIGVVYGGRSREHEVSLKSAASVIDALDRDKYEILPIGITKDNRWMIDAPPSAMHVGREFSMIPDVVVRSVDLFFPVMHGTNGEDGAIQGFFQMLDKPYVGAGIAGSAVGMDKAIFKYVMEAHGLPILPWELILTSEWNDNPQEIIGRLEEKLSYPMFTKPANLGSSVGISLCRDGLDLFGGLQAASKLDRRIVVEQGINVRELEVSVMGNDYPVASVVGEIRPEREFYDYDAKYVTDDSKLIIPAKLTDEESNDLRDLAVKAYKAIDCAGLGRVDFLLDTDTEKIYVNEINTLPGFTNISMYPKLWEASGLSFTHLLDRLIEFALRE